MNLTHSEGTEVGAGGTRLLAVFMAAAFTLGAPEQTVAQIAGTAHDLSGEIWSTGEVCDVCHTPHGANSAAPDAPLWNHEVTTATFITYSSPTMDETPLAPRGPSRLCLSCHDGTVAVDSYGGNTGGEFMGGEALMGIDLSDDHPVSVHWDHQTTINDCSVCHLTHPWTFNNELPFSERYLECSTCHDVHGTPEPKLLRKTLNGSQLCLHCHQK